MQLKITPAFAIGDTVYLRVCKEKEAGMVTGLTIRQGPTLLYIVQWNSNWDSYYDFELTTEFVPDYGA